MPRELNTDQSAALEAAQLLGFVTRSMLELNLGWERARAAAAVDDLVAASLVWVDSQPPETEFWSPAFMCAAAPATATAAAAAGGGAAAPDAPPVT